MTAEIAKTAKKYQDLDRKIKDLTAKQKPLKADLLEYAQGHKSDFDKAFQLKFPCGVYISQRVADCLEGDKESKSKLILEVDKDFLTTDLDEKAILVEAGKNSRVRKLLTKLGLKISQKESLAIYAG